MISNYRGHSLAIAIVAATIFCVVFSINLRYPGLFMDSINPEYLAPLILDPNGSHDMFAYALPGNMIDGRFPVLAGSFYHGPLQLYLSLPVFAAFGTDIIGARVAQGMFGLLLFLSVAALLRQQRVRLPLLAAGLGLLVADPTFVQSFKTQALSTLWPLCMVLMAAWLIERRAAIGRPTGIAIPIMSGVLAGLSFFSYFIYLFFLPAQIAHIALCARAGGAKKPAIDIGAFLAGFAIGCLPYILGYALMAATLGSEGIGEFLAGNGRNLVAPPPGDVLSSTYLVARIGGLIEATVSDAWLTMTIFSSEGSSALGIFKLLLLLTLVAIGLFARTRDGRGRTFFFAVGCLLSFVVLSSPVATRLHGHHYVILLPLFYLAATLALEMIAERIPAQRMHRVVVALLPIALLVDNVYAHLAFQRKLEVTHGVGDYSAEINRLAEDALQEGKNDLYLFPDWGFFMPFAFQTGGRVAYVADESSDDAIRRRVLGAICRGRNVALVRAGNGAPDSRLDPLLAKKNGWVGDAARRSLLERRADAGALVSGVVPTTSGYALPDGSPVFDLHRFPAFSDPETEPVCEGMAVPQCKLDIGKPDSSLVATPCAIDRCPTSGLPEVTLAWKAPGARNIEIWVGSRGGEKKLWVAGASTGQDKTGPWANSGTEFEMREAGTGTVLATLRLGGSGCGGG